MRVSFRHRGSFNKTERFLRKALDLNLEPIFHRYGILGLEALQDATPVDTGETSTSWRYELKRVPYGYKLSWHNDNVVDGLPIAILIQYGHGTRSGTFVEGTDFINPAIGSILDDIADDIWKEVTIV